MSTRLHDVIIICVCISQSFVSPVSAFVSNSDPLLTLKRTLENDEPLEPEIDELDEPESPMIHCGEELRTQPGRYTFLSEGGAQFCTLYLMAPVDNVIEMEFLFFNVDCAENSVVAILDGWEVDGWIFPSPSDHHQSMSRRYLTYCGESSPRGLIESSQNIVQVVFDVPTMAQGFMINVKFKRNHKPCNMMVWQQRNDRIVVSNYGQKRNCTVMSLFPQQVQFQYVNVGEVSTRQDYWYTGAVRGVRNRLKTYCNTMIGEDSVNVYEGHGVGPIHRRKVLGFCGARLRKKATRPLPLRCHSSSVTLVSSGEFYNKIMFSFLPAKQDDVTVC